MARAPTVAESLLLTGLGVLMSAQVLTRDGDRGAARIGVFVGAGILALALAAAILETWLDRAPPARNRRSAWREPPGHRGR